MVWIPALTKNAMSNIVNMMLHYRKIQKRNNEPIKYKFYKCTMKQVTC